MYLISTPAGDPLFVTENDTSAEMARMEGRSVEHLDAAALADPDYQDLIKDLPVR